MGIRGLKTFLSRTCPETLQHERIEVLADLHRRKDGFNGKVQIVVDGPMCCFEVYGDADIRCGGQFHAFKTQIREFVDAFKRLDISLVFFFVGCIPEDVIEKWLARELKNEGLLQENYAGSVSQFHPKYCRHHAASSKKIPKH